MTDLAEFMRRFYAEVYNRRNVEFLRQHLHPEVVAMIRRVESQNARECWIPFTGADSSGPRK